MIRDLPFCEEIVLPKVFTKHTLPSYDISEEKQHAIEEFINNLSFKYDPQTFKNLTYARKKAYVKAELLEKPEEDVSIIISILLSIIFFYF